MGILHGSCAIVGHMSDMNPRIWEGQFCSAKESPALTPGTFRNRRRTSITVWLPPTRQFTKGALVQLIMAECKTLGAIIFFIFEFIPTNAKKSTKNGVPPPTSVFRTHHPTKSGHAKVSWNDQSLYSSSSMAKYITLKVIILRVNLVLSKKGRSLSATSSPGDQEPGARDF